MDKVYTEQDFMNDDPNDKDKRQEWADAFNKYEYLRRGDYKTPITDPNKLIRLIYEIYEHDLEVSNLLKEKKDSVVHQLSYLHGSTVSMRHAVSSITKLLELFEVDGVKIFKNESLRLYEENFAGKPVSTISVAFDNKGNMTAKDKYSEGDN